MWSSESRMTDALHRRVETANARAIDATLGSQQRILHSTCDILSWASVIRIPALTHLTNVKVVQLDRDKHVIVYSEICYDCLL